MGDSSSLELHQHGHGCKELTQANPTSHSKESNILFSFPPGFHFLMTKPKLFTVVQINTAEGFSKTQGEQERNPGSSQALLQLVLQE